MQAYRFSAPSIFLLCSAALCAWLVLHALRQRHTRFTISYAILMVCSMLYALGYGLELAAPDLIHMKMMLRIQYLALPFVPLVWVMQAWSYMDPRGLPAKFFSWMLFLSSAFFLLYQSNDLHHLYYTTLTYTREGDLAIARTGKGPLYWLYITYLNCCVAAGITLLFRAWRQAIPLYQRQALFLLLGSFFPWSFHLVYQLGISPGNLDLAPFGLVATGLLFAVASWRHSLLDVLPMARDVIFEGIAEGVIVLDTANRIIDFNHAAKIFFPNLNQRSIGLAYSALDQEGDFSRALLQQEKFAYPQTTEDGLRHLDIRCYPLRNHRGSALGKTVLIQDVTEHRLLMDELKKIATHDELTGVFNRRHLVELSGREVLLARRYQHPLSAIIVDIDFFKDVNDRQGHLAGDKLLRDIARTLRLRLRATDILGRYGGDEFIIILPDTRADSAVTLAENMNQACFEECGAHLSMGIAALTAGTPDFNALFKQADEALYRAKNSGRNRVECYLPASENCQNPTST